MKLLKRNTRKNRLINDLRDIVNDRNKRIIELLDLGEREVETASIWRERCDYFYEKVLKLEKERDSLLEYKAKYYSLIKNL